MHRAESVACRPCIESCLLLAGVSLPPELRAVPHVRAFLTEACTHAGAVNRLAALAGDIAARELADADAERARADRYCALLAECDTRLGTVETSATALLAWSPEPTLRAFVYAVIDAVNGHTEWFDAGRGATAD